MITIAIADDSAFHCEILSLYVKNHSNLSISIEVANGADLINELNKCPQLPKICILDLHMPIMDGIATAKIINRQFPDLRVFGYTSSKNSEEIDQYSKFVNKVFNKDCPAALFQEINHIM